MGSVINSTVAATPAEVAEDVVILLSKAAAAALRIANLSLEPYGLRARHYAALRMAATRDGVAQRTARPVGARVWTRAPGRRPGR